MKDKKIRMLKMNKVWKTIKMKINLSITILVR